MNLTELGSSSMVPRVKICLRNLNEVLKDHTEFHGTWGNFKKGFCKYVMIHIEKNMLRSKYVHWIYHEGSSMLSQILVQKRWLQDPWPTQIIFEAVCLFYLGLFDKCSLEFLICCLFWCLLLVFALKLYQYQCYPCAKHSELKLWTVEEPSVFIKWRINKNWFN